MIKYFTFALLPLIICCNSKTITVGTEITGDFDGDGKIDTAKAVQTKFGNGSVESGKSNAFKITFDNSIKSQEITCNCKDVILVNEGNLNGKSGDEISVVDTNNDSNIVGMMTYTIENNRWVSIAGPSILGNAKTALKEKLQSYIIKENEKIFQYSYSDGITTNNDGNIVNKIVKKEVFIK